MIKDRIRKVDTIFSITIVALMLASFALEVLKNWTILWIFLFLYPLHLLVFAVDLLMSKCRVSPGSELVILLSPTLLITLFYIIVFAIGPV